MAIIADEAQRIIEARNIIRTKLVDFGLSTSEDNITALAIALDKVVNRGAIIVTIPAGGSYKIPAGYHNGLGIIRSEEGIKDRAILGEAIIGVMVLGKGK